MKQGITPSAQKIILSGDGTTSSLEYNVYQNGVGCFKRFKGKDYMKGYKSNIVFIPKEHAQKIFDAFKPPKEKKVIISASNRFTKLFMMLGWVKINVKYEEDTE